MIELEIPETKQFSKFLLAHFRYNGNGIALHKVSDRKAS